jgi:hypothetical protein
LRPSLAADPRSGAAKIGEDADYANSYVYDALGRLVTLVQTDQAENAVTDKRVDLIYNADGQLAGSLYWASTDHSSIVGTSNFYRDAAGRLIYIDHNAWAPGSTYAEEHGYGYDDANRLTSYASVHRRGLIVRATSAMAVCAHFGATRLRA